MSRYIDKEGEETKEKIIEFANGAFVIIKINAMIDFKEYENFIKRVEDAVRNGALIVPPDVDVIVIDKEGKAVKA